MAEYRKKPVVINAFKWLRDQEASDVPIWFIDSLKSGVAKVCREEQEISYYDNGVPEYEVLDVWVEIETLEGTMRASHGDYIIKGIQGEIYPCKPDIFKETYEEV